MKLKKGFTLVEVLAVVVLIGLLVVITVPSIKTIMNNAKEKSLERQIASIIESSKSWSIENVDKLPDNNVPILVSLSELKEQGFLEDKEIINPVNNKEITGCVEIKYDIDFNQYKYNYKEDCELEMPDEILISSISLNTTSVSIINGGTYQIEANIIPSNATNKNLKYTSNNESIVSVTDTGLITGISGGETTITVSTIDGSNISKVIEVIVRQQISNVELNTTSVSIINGGTYQIKATITPNDATNKSLSYTSNNESIATVSSTGLITGISGGETIITVSTTDGSNISKSIDVIVREQIESVTLSETNIEINKGQSKIVTATITPSNAFNKTLRWESEDDSIATVNNGVITGINVGTTKVIVSTTDGSNITKEINVKVNSIMTSTHTCVTNTNTICSRTDIINGILVNVRVNDNEDYDFYVVSDTGSELTLIMDRNLGDKVDWYTSSSVNNSYGPITALTYLKTLTSTWTNIDLYSYKLINDSDGLGGNYGYTEVTGDYVTDVRARMLTRSEASALGCTTTSSSCPNWLYKNLNQTSSCGYWLSTAYSPNPWAWVTYYTGMISWSGIYNGENTYGIRPVIKISKNQ